jgi:ABC-type enterochelin transport system ATPase subunit
VTVALRKESYYYGDYAILRFCLQMNQQGHLMQLRFMIISLLKSLAGEMTVVMVTHNGELAAYSDRIIYLKEEMSRNEKHE